MMVQVQMTVYGHAITYGTIGTVVAGILAAFASKVLIQEIGAIWLCTLQPATFILLITLDSVILAPKYDNHNIDIYIMNIVIIYH